MKRLRGLQAMAGCLVLLAAPVWAQVQGAGASFPSKVYERWAQTFEKSTGIKVAYTATGSADGLKQITARTVQLGGSDTPLPPEELARRKLIQLPMLVGGIVPVVHLPGVADNQLRLTGELLADIMAGRVRQWNDPRIAALNAGLALPAQPIRRIVRSDKSGTTEGLTRYLAGASDAFKAEPGVSQLPKWTGDVLAVEGNDGMVKALRATPGAIAYVSHDRVERDQLVAVKLRNAAGNYVAASEAGFRSAVVESELSRRGDDAASLMDRPGPATWPITMTSFLLVDAEPARADAASPAVRFVYWCFMHGDDLTRGTGFAPIPVALQSRLAGRLMAVKAQDGKLLSYLGM
ncbi:phosphate ABC transporter substrate-binding protein PstS [Ideonella sp. BN130291]|uniref:phosphate ABC transporter substrate-binding protein PstS n=1 Tax=Ideonella sp. BN130291 TaxID=3112940 RepID=UPI002E25603C|nr:phosphate ABC transporter substrate-binding protein PstS [Ideonella sp. BN130291]